MFSESASRPRRIVSLLKVTEVTDWADEVILCLLLWFFWINSECVTSPSASTVHSVFDVSDWTLIFTCCLYREQKWTKGNPVRGQIWAASQPTVSPCSEARFWSLCLLFSWIFDLITQTGSNWQTDAEDRQSSDTRLSLSPVHLHITTI